MLPIDRSNTPMIYEAIRSLQVPCPAKFFFVIRKDQNNNGCLANVLHDICNELGYQGHVIEIEQLSDGPATSAYACKSHLSLDAPLIVSNSDQVLQWSYCNFMDVCKPYDGAVLCYTPSYQIEIGSADKHSFVRLDNDNKAVEFKEKVAISNHALVGVHYFSQAQHFIDAYDDMIRANYRAPNGEFYLSICYDVMLQQCKTVGMYKLNGTDERYYPVGEPDDYFAYLYEKGGYMPLIGSSVRLPDDVDVSFHRYAKNERVPFERNGDTVVSRLLLAGAMSVNGMYMPKRKLFVIHPNEVYCPIFHEESVVITIRSKTQDAKNLPKPPIHVV